MHRSIHRSIQILSIVLLLTFGSVVSAQTPVTCGIVGIDGPAQVAAGPPLVLKVKVTGMTHTTKPQFNWTLSAGTITSGQGTGEISIDTVGLGGFNVTTTVQLSGASLGCNGTASITTHIEPPGVACGGPPFDQYGDIEFDDEKARLDNFAIQLSNEPLATGYIIMSAGQITFENEAMERLDRAKSYIVNVREIDPNRVVTVDCGFAPDLSIKLYIGPLGSPPPECSNPLESSAEIKFTKPRPKAVRN